MLKRLDWYIIKIFGNVHFFHYTDYQHFSNFRFNGKIDISLKTMRHGKPLYSITI